MKFIHTGDIHLGAEPEKGHPLSKVREQEIWDSFKRLLEKASQEQADLLLITGDFFHRQPLKGELREVDYLFSQIPNTQVVVIAGNHDYIGKQSYYRDFGWSDNVHFLGEDNIEKIYLENLNVYVYGCSYHSREILENRYDNLIAGKEKGTHILLAHGGDEKHVPINYARLAEAGFDYVALGHIHKPAIIRENKMAYCGALEPLDRNDTGEHGYISGEIREDGQVRIKLIPFSTREYKDLEVITSETMGQSQLEEKVVEEIGREGSNNFYCVIARGEREEDLVYSRERLLALGNVLEVIDNTRPSYDYDRLRREYQGTILGEYISSFAKAEELPDLDSVEGKALRYGVEALLDAEKAL